MKESVLLYTFDKFLMEITLELDFSMNAMTGATVFFHIGVILFI